MNFSCTKQNLADALLLVGGVAGKNPNLPILNNVLLRASSQGVEISSTNLDVAITATLRAIVTTEGSFTVPARTLSEVVHFLSQEKVDLELKETDLVVVCGKTTTKIKGMSADDFPVIPTLDEGRGLVLDADGLKTALLQVVPAVAKTDIRPELSGVLWSVTGQGGKNLVLAATDSYRLAEKSLPLVQGPGDDELRVILPGRCAQELLRLLGALQSPSGEQRVRVLVGENQVAINYGQVQLVSRLVAGGYPDYAQIIPQTFKTTAQFSVAELSKETRAAGLFTTAGINAVILTLKPQEGEVSISAASAQAGDYQSGVAAQVTGEENTVLLNHRYLLDGLSALGGEQAELKMISGDNPCLLTSPHDQAFRYIIMPVRQ